MYKQHTLSSMFAGMLKRQGYEIELYEDLEAVQFENFAFKACISFDKIKKRHKVNWRMKPGYELFDVYFRVPPGALISAEFKNVHDVLNFLQRRLIWKKQK